MRRQLALRPLLPYPTHRDRVIDHVPRHRADQHPKSHLIRTHHRPIGKV
ncbi:MAG TPA: hypothetical protein VEL76_03870 [Gemmataceae bacterium]|nr:hypothetical protein [Gemmataceae bacterium]